MHAGDGVAVASLAGGILKGEQVNKRTHRAPASDGTMTLRAWARSRRLPISTAHRAVTAGRISRDARGRLNPEQADREWVENTRGRIDGRTPTVPGQSSDAVGSDLQPMTPEQLEERYGMTLPDPDATVRVADAMTVHAAQEDLLAVKLVWAVNGAILDIAPKLARPQDGAWLAERLYDALRDGWLYAASEWRRRVSLEGPPAA